MRNSVPAKKIVKRPLSLAVIATFAALCGASPGWAGPLLGDAESFAVLAAQTVTNVPASTIVGNVGVSAGTAITGFNSTPGTATADPQVTGGGLVHSNTAVAAGAQSSLTTARTNLALLGPRTLLPADLAGLTIFPGVYTLPFGATNLSGTVTLDGLNDANAFWLFETESSLITSPGSVVNVVDAGTGAGVFWNVASSATLDTTTSFEGNILALTSIFLKTGATIGCGRALADNGEVTMEKNAISIDCLGTGEEGSNGLSGSGLAFIAGDNILIDTTTGTVVSLEDAFAPEPGTLALLGFGMAGLIGFGRRR